MPGSRSLSDPSASGKLDPADVQCLVTAHNGPQVTIHYKRAEVLGCLQGVLNSRLGGRWTPPPQEETYGLQMAVEGGSVQLQVHKDREQQGGGKRREIKGLSRQSRSRLIHRLASINREAYDPRRIRFMTLTYHNGWSEDPSEQYDQLRRWFKRMNRRWPGLIIQWRKEWQHRLAPHWHLIVYTPAGAISAEDGSGPFMDDAVREWISVVRRPCDSEEHMYRRAVKGRMMESWRGAISYASKTAEYISKTETVQPVDENGQALPTGRLWGTLGNKKKLPIDYDLEPLTEDEYVRGRRVARRLLRPKTRRWTRRKIPRREYKNQRFLLDYWQARKLVRWLRC